MRSLLLKYVNTDNSSNDDMHLYRNDHNRHVNSDMIRCYLERNYPGNCFDIFQTINKMKLNHYNKIIEI